MAHHLLMNSKRRIMEMPNKIPHNSVGSNQSTIVSTTPFTVISMSCQLVCLVN
jgi:hypothetical protein